MTIKEQKVIDSFLELSPEEQRSVAKAIYMKLQNAEDIQLSKKQLKEILSRRDEMIKNPSIGIPEEEFWKNFEKDR